MFEDSIFESTGAIRTRSRRWMLATFALNGSVLLALILLPLIYPQALPSLSTPTLMTAPAPPSDTPRPKPEPAQAIATHPQMQVSFPEAPSRIPRQFPSSDTPEATTPIEISGSVPGGPGTAGPDNPWGDQRPVVVVQQQPRATARVSGGVMAGRIYDRVLPQYPPIAKAAGIQGTVVLQATISKNGAIEHLQVLSGPALLQQAAIDAVRQWRYRPYLLNGEPVDVETTVNVVFQLN